MQGLCLGVESKAALPTLHTQLVYQHQHWRIWQSATATACSYPRFALPVSPGLFGITPATFVSPGAKARAAPLPAGRPSTRSRNGRCSGAKGSARHCCGGHGCRQGRLVHRAQHNVARSGPVAEGGRGPLPGPLKVPGAETLLHAGCALACSCCCRMAQEQRPVVATLLSIRTRVAYAWAARCAGRVRGEDWRFWHGAALGRCAEPARPADCLSLYEVASCGSVMAAGEGRRAQQSTALSTPGVCTQVSSSAPSATSFLTRR